MVVLEGLACGLPALVTQTGGPKEIIEQDVTGKVVPSDDPALWLEYVNAYRTMKKEDPVAYENLRQDCVAQVNRQNNWQPVFDEVLGDVCLLPDTDTDTDADIDLAVAYDNTPPLPNKAA